MTVEVETTVTGYRLAGVAPMVAIEDNDRVDVWRVKTPSGNPNGPQDCVVLEQGDRTIVVLLEDLWFAVQALTNADP